MPPLILLAGLRVKLTETEEQEKIRKFNHRSICEGSVKI